MDGKIKVGLMGGTFNPIHNAHLLLAKKAKEQFLLDKVLFIPSGVSYFKRNQNVLSAKIRYEMTELAIKNIDGFDISSIETDRGGDSYSYETVLELKKINPDWEMYFIMGADSLMMIDTWKCPDLLMKHCHLIVTVRDEVDRNLLDARIKYLEETFGASILTLYLDKIDLSSTMIRQYVKEGKSIQEFVPEQVNLYIKNHQLYL